MELSDFTQSFVPLPNKGRLSYYFNEMDKVFPYIMLLPGSFAPAQQYQEMISFLPDTLNVIVMEYRGHGKSWPPFKRGSIPKITQDVIRVLNYLKIEKIYAAGHSIGGMVAIDLGGTIPERMLGIISMEGWTHHTATKNAYRGTLNNTLTPDQQEIRQSLRDSVLNSWKKRQIKHFGSFWKNWNGFSILESTKIPILEIYGDRGMEYPPTQEQLLIPKRENIEFNLISNGSHSIPIQFPNILAELILNFIQKHT